MTTPPSLGGHALDDGSLVFVYSSDIVVDVDADELL